MVTTGDMSVWQTANRRPKANQPQTRQCHLFQTVPGKYGNTRKPVSSPQILWVLSHPRYDPGGRETEPRTGGERSLTG